jgi:hypothetical protein
VAWDPAASNRAVAVSAEIGVVVGCRVGAGVGLEGGPGVGFKIEVAVNGGVGIEVGIMVGSGVRRGVAATSGVTPGAQPHPVSKTKTRAKYDFKVKQRFFIPLPFIYYTESLISGNYPTKLRLKPTSLLMGHGFTRISGIF